MVPRTLLLACLLAGCNPEYEPAAQARILTTDPLLDAGLLAVGERQTLTLMLRSEGPAPVTVEEITVEGDADAFVVLAWADEDGALELPRGSEQAPATEIVQVSYRPTTVGTHRAVLTVISTDTQVEDGAWRVALRGRAIHPCGALSPARIDFGSAGIASYHTETATVQNCGQVPLTIAAFDLGDTATFSVTSPSPIYVAPGSTEAVEIAWVPADRDPDGAMIHLLTSDPDRALALEVLGNDCARSVDAAWDDDGDGWFSCGGDCDDTDPDVSPSAIEVPNGLDDDCDGETDEGANAPASDDDGDGVSEEDGDCDDADGEVHPDATETLDQRDEDCDGQTDEDTERYDDDGDGLSEEQGDCDDGDAAVHFGATELENGLDDDCDGQVDEGSAAFDDDGDGASEEEGDCDDADPWAFPGATEDCDGVDQDCDGEVDEEDACAYLAERTVDTGEGGPGGCAGAPGRGSWALLAVFGWLGLAARAARGAQSPQAPVR
ncbi:MAG: MopE-related protein [Pseudomonadota bacterium]